MPRTDTSRPSGLQTLTVNPTLVRLSKEQQQPKKPRRREHAHQENRREHAHQENRREHAHQEPRRKNGSRTTTPDRCTRQPAAEHTPEIGNGPKHEHDNYVPVSQRRRKRDEMRTPYGWRRD